MVLWLLAVLLALGAVGVAVVLIVRWGERRWVRATGAVLARLAGMPAPAAAVAEADWAGLPEPVQRYFRFALSPGRPVIARARFEQAGTFRAGGRDARWSPFTAVQHFVTAPRAFVWDARIRTAPWLKVLVRDSYLDGVGSMQAAVAGLVTVADQSGTPAMAAGALHRYLAEAVWLPTALLPRAGVRWEATDDPRRARAALGDGQARVALEFEIDDDGAIVSAYTPSRFRDVDGTPVPTPWRCRYRKYAPFEGFMLPTEGEVEWLLPEGPLSYWRGNIVDVAYETAPVSR